GEENGLPYCVPTAAPDEAVCDQDVTKGWAAGYLADNDFDGLGGTPWQNGTSAIYAFNDAFDTVGPWRSIHADLCTIALHKQHGPNELDASINASASATSGPGWDSLDYHWLTSFFNYDSECGAVCDGAAGPCNGHRQVVSTSKCAKGSVGEAKLS